MIREIELNRIREVLDPTWKEKKEKKSAIEEEEIVIDAEYEDKTIDEIEGDKRIEEKKNEGIFGKFLSIGKNFFF